MDLPLSYRQNNSTMKWLRKIFKGISLTAAMFVFQACYGSMDAENYLGITVRVVDAENNMPLQDVKVESQRMKVNRSSHRSHEDWRMLGYTDSAGIADIYCYITPNAFDKLRFTAQDSSYAVFDTIVNHWTDTLDIVLHPVD